MLLVFKRELRANAKALLFWALGMLALAAIGFYEYGGVANAQDINLIFEMMPRMMRVMFGIGALPLNTPEGYYACMYLWLTFIAFLHAAMLGATLLSKEERDKTADFLFALPLSRPAAVTGKVLAGLLNMLLLALIAWGTSLVALLPQVESASLAGDIHLTMLGMFAAQIVFFFAGLVGAAAFREHRRAGQFAAGVVIVTYLISVFIEMSGEADFLDFLSPFRYFDAVRVIENGLNPLFLLLSAALAAGLGLLAYSLYRRRDLKN